MNEMGRVVTRHNQEAGEHSIPTTHAFHRQMGDMVDPTEYSASPYSTPELVFTFLVFAADMSGIAKTTFNSFPGRERIEA